MNSSLTALPPHLTVNIPRDLIDVDSDFDSSSRASSRSGRKRTANSQSPARTPVPKKARTSAKPAAKKKSSKPVGTRSSPRSAARKKGRNATKFKSSEMVESMESDGSDNSGAAAVDDGSEVKKEDLDKKMFEKVKF